MFIVLSRLREKAGKFYDFGGHNSGQSIKIRLAEQGMLQPMHHPISPQASRDRGTIVLSPAGGDGYWSSHFSYYEGPGLFPIGYAPGVRGFHVDDLAQPA